MGGGARNTICTPDFISGGINITGLGAWFEVSSFHLAKKGQARQSRALHARSSTDLASGPDKFKLNGPKGRSEHSSLGLGSGFPATDEFEG